MRFRQTVVWIDADEAAQRVTVDDGVKRRRQFQIDIEKEEVVAQHAVNLNASAIRGRKPVRLKIDGYINGLQSRVAIDFDKVMIRAKVGFDDSIDELARRRRK